MIKIILVMVSAISDTLWFVERKRDTLYSLPFHAGKSGVTPGRLDIIAQVGHCFGIKEYQIGIHSFTYETFADQIVHHGGQTSHLADGVSQRKKVLFSHVVDQNPGDGAKMYGGRWVFTKNRRPYRTSCGPQHHPLSIFFIKIVIDG